MSLCCHPLECSVDIYVYVWENVHKIGSSKDFLMNIFCFLAVLQRNTLESKQKTLQQYFKLRIIPPSDEKRKKHQKLGTVGSSFDLNVSSQGVNKAHQDNQMKWWYSKHSRTYDLIGIDPRPISMKRTISIKHIKINVIFKDPGQLFIYIMIKYLKY